MKPSEAIPHHQSMAYGNSSSHKRGWLRPGPGSRLPAILIIALTAGCSLLIYNVYTNTNNRIWLEEELRLVEKKLQSCQRDKTELETRFETHMRSFRTLKEEVEGLRVAEQSAEEVRKKLKQCRTQVETAQKEQSELKEKDKSELETCQRKVTEVEEKLETSVQEKARLETEVQGLRSELREVPRRYPHEEGSLNTHQQVKQLAPELPAIKATLLPEVSADRGAAAAASEPAIAANQPTHLLDSSIPGQTPAAHQIGSLQLGQDSNDKVADSAPLGTGGGSATSSPSMTQDGLREGQSTNRFLTAVSSMDDKLGTPPPNRSGAGGIAGNNAAIVPHDNAQAPTVTKGFDIVANQQVIENLTDTSNATSIRDSAAPSSFPRRGEPLAVDPAATEADTMRKKKEKERRLNKVIEESGPIPAERHRAPADSKRDRSRGEEDDTEPLADAGGPPARKSKWPADNGKRAPLDTLGGSVNSKENKANEYHHGGSDTAMKQQPAAADSNNNNARPGGGGGGERRSEEGQQLLATAPSVALAPAAAAALKEDLAVAENVAVGPPPPAPDAAAAAGGGKRVNRKGLKDDYHYKDEDEEQHEPALRAGGKDAAAAAAAAAVPRHGADDQEQQGSNERYEPPPKDKAEAPKKTADNRNKWSKFDDFAPAAAYHQQQQVKPPDFDADKE